MAPLLNFCVNKRREIRFMETHNKLIKYHQLALPQIGSNSASFPTSLGDFLSLNWCQISLDHYYNYRSLNAFSLRALIGLVR